MDDDVLTINELDDSEYSFDEENITENADFAEINESEEDLELIENEVLEEEPDDSIDEVITNLLKVRGIDPESVKIETDKGLESIPFNKLSNEEKFLILNSSELDDDYGLDENEIGLINLIRSNRWSVADYNNYIANQAVLNYVNSQQPEQKYSVDSIQDDELFVLDLQSRIPDISEEDAVYELNQAKNNPALYEKKIQSLRQDYKDRENQLIVERQEKIQLQQNEAMNQFTNTILGAIQDNETIDIGDSLIELSAEDKNDIASFILDKDLAGNRYIAQALNDPHTLVQMVWFALKGQDAFDLLLDYYKQQITQVAKTNYTRGYDDAKSGRAQNSTKAVVRKRSIKNSPGTSLQELTIDDIDII